MAVRGLHRVSIEAFPNPDVNVDVSRTTISSGDTVVISASGLVDYRWFADSVSLSFTNDQIEYAPTNTTTIEWGGQDQNGCFGNAEITLNVAESNIGDRLIQ